MSFFKDTLDSVTQSLVASSWFTNSSIFNLSLPHGSNVWIFQTTVHTEFMLFIDSSWPAMTWCPLVTFLVNNNWFDLIEINPHSAFIMFISEVYVCVLWRCFVQAVNTNTSWMVLLLHACLLGFLFPCRNPYVHRFFWPDNTPDVFFGFGIVCTSCWLVVSHSYTFCTCWWRWTPLLWSVALAGAVF